MQIFAFVIAVVAAALFAVEASRTKSFVAWGLVALTVAWIVQNVYQSASTIVIH